MKRKLALATVVCGVIAALIAATATRSRASQGAGSQALVGSWEVRVTANAVPPFDEFITFTSGGGLVETNNAFPPAAASPGHGSWEHAGARRFDFTFFKLLFDQQGQFTGRLRVRGTIELHGRDAWSGTATADILDPAGTPIPGTADTTTAQATRLAAAGV